MTSTYLLCTLTRVASLKWSKRAFLRDKLVQQDGVILSIGHVATEVIHSERDVSASVVEYTLENHVPTFPAGLFQVVVEPSQQNMVGGQT